MHTLFSLLDLNRAYVTDRGRLVGVVALRDVSSFAAPISYMVENSRLKL